MKELSIEEKAKAYDEVRDKIALRFGANVAKEIFSQFEESKDEKIRKALIEACKQSLIVGGFHKDKVIAWLEKQGQTFTKKDIDDAYLKGICDAKHELEKQGEKGTNGNEREIPNSVWNEEDEKMFRGIITICDIWSTKTSFYPKQNDDIVNLKKWFKSIKDRVQPQTTWKPSDEQMDALRYVTNFDYGGYKATLVSLYEQLKKLRGE